MVKGTLHINKGIWHVSFCLYDTNGKRHQKQLSTGVKALNSKGTVISGSKKKATEKMNEILESYDGLSYDKSAEILLSDYVADWIERNRISISGTTYDNYRHMLEKHIKPYFDDLKITVKKVKPADIERYSAYKLDTLSPNTIVKHIRLISPALQDAVKNNVVKSNAALLANKPKIRKPKNNYYSAQELRHMLMMFNDSPIKIPVFLATIFGLRRSEVLGLTWSDIDFRNRTLSINKVAVRMKVNGKLRTVVKEETKTEDSARTFPLNDALCNYLLHLKEIQERYIRETNAYLDFICINEVGDLLKPDYVTSVFNKTLKRANMQHIRFHDLRHSCLSILANNSNFTMKQVQDYAGHSNFLTTANIYSHVDINSKIAEVNTLTNAIGDIFLNEK